MKTKTSIALTLVLVGLSTTGCTRCRNLFRRGASCGGTAMVAPATMGAPVPLSAPVPASPPVQYVQPGVMQPTFVPQPQYCCPPQQMMPMCQPCVPCDPCGGYEQNCFMGAGNSGQQPVWFGGYVDDKNSTATPQSTFRKDPEPQPEE